MPSLDDYIGKTPAWCPGCGNFSILKVFKEAMLELGLEPHRFLIVSGIGQAGKFPHYLKCNTFNGLHGRSLPVATGFRLANNKMPVIVVSGDGDCYGEGGNHLLHGIRRNLNLKYFVHDNQIYGLTKGQGSPTTMEGMPTKNLPFGVISNPLNPLAFAISLNCSFVARAFAGDQEQLRFIMKEAMNHQGFAIVDILQPCVSFNKVNTYEWYKQRVYHLDSTYDCQDRIKAFEKALEWGDRIPTGILFKCSRPLFEDKISFISSTPLKDQSFDIEKVSKTLREFFV